jgi:hypothetical protein
MPILASRYEFPPPKVSPPKKVALITTPNKSGM